MRSPCCLCICMSVWGQKRLVCVSVCQSPLSLLGNGSVSRRQLGKHVPAATKNCWTRRFLCHPYSIKGRYTVLAMASCNLQLC
jgi:hypothetical protein